MDSTAGAVIAALARVAEEHFAVAAEQFGVAAGLVRHVLRHRHRPGRRDPRKSRGGRHRLATSPSLRHGTPPSRRPAFATSGVFATAGVFAGLGLVAALGLLAGNPPVTPDHGLGRRYRHDDSRFGGTGQSTNITSHILHNSPQMKGILNCYTWQE